MFNLFIENFLIRINWARGTQVSYTNGQSDGDHPRAANPISLHPPWWHHHHPMAMSCSYFSHARSATLPLTAVMLPLLLSVLPLGQCESPWWTKFLPVRLKVVQPLSVSSWAVWVQWLCGLQCSVSLPFVLCCSGYIFSHSNWGKVSDCVSQALVAHRQNTSKAVAEERTGGQG